MKLKTALFTAFTLCSICSASPNDQTSNSSKDTIGLIANIGERLLGNLHSTPMFSHVEGFDYPLDQSAIANPVRQSIQEQIKKRFDKNCVLISPARSELDLYLNPKKEVIYNKSKYLAQLAKENNVNHLIIVQSLSMIYSDSDAYKTGFHIPDLMINKSSYSKKDQYSLALRVAYRFVHYDAVMGPSGRGQAVNC